jgi:hypothetical protein
VSTGRATKFVVLTKNIKIKLARMSLESKQQQHVRATTTSSPALRNGSPTASTPTTAPQQFEPAVQAQPASHSSSSPSKSPGFPRARCTTQASAPRGQLSSSSITSLYPSPTSSTRRTAASKSSCPTSTANEKTSPRLRCG